MIKLLIYGKGTVYETIKKFIDWQKVSLVAFIDSYALENKIEYTHEGVRIIHPSQIKKEEYDYILCASIYEDEMRETLKKLQIPNNKIISGKLDWENVLENSFLYDLSRVLIYQNGEIERTANLIKERNRFCDIRQGMPWMDEKTSIIGDGAWAVGYDYLSVLCRILQIMKPQNILEMGLGQSSKVIMNYTNHHDCNFKIIEQDEEWYNTFKEENENLANESEIFIKPINKVYNEKYGVNINCYSDISDVIADEKFDVISIDGPWGSDGISRIDILSYVPKCLNKSWCIMLDDYEREGEKNMIFELENILQKNMVNYHKKVYGKYRQLCLLTSEENKFLCSLF